NCVLRRQPICERPDCEVGVSVSVQISEGRSVPVDAGERLYERHGPRDVLELDSCFSDLDRARPAHEVSYSPFWDANLVRFRDGFRCRLGRRGWSDFRRVRWLWRGRRRRGGQWVSGRTGRKQHGQEDQLPAHTPSITTSTTAPNPESSSRGEAFTPTMRLPSW